MKRIAIVLGLVFTCSGCLRSTTVISVKSDGSGTIVQETGMSPQALAMLQGMAASAEGGKTLPNLFGEEQSKKAAAAMGVQFVSGEPIKTAEIEGYRARFAFTDVRTLRMKLNPETATAGKNATSRDSPFGFELEKRGASSVLTILVPEPPATSGASKPTLSGLPTGADAQQNEQALQMMKLMMQGLFVDVSVDVDGRIIKTDAPHVTGSRVTLLQLDFNKLLTDDAALQKLQGASDLKSLQGVPGLKVIANPKVTVEFAR